MLAPPGMWRYSWGDGVNFGLSPPPFGLSQSSGNVAPGLSLPSMASDGRYLYILNSKEGLLKARHLNLLLFLKRPSLLTPALTRIHIKVGTGIDGTHTVRGHVYAYKSRYAVQTDQRAWLVYVNNSLYYKSSRTPFPMLIKINPHTLEVLLTAVFISVRTHINRQVYLMVPFMDRILRRRAR